ncbi:MAG: DUF3426 domain-containing protein [Candidatus Deferrimicrobium sp.]|nr:DUF3426 domain-containing protein [Candidatus Deferrimicrobium sp.]
MIIECQTCHARFRLDESRIKGRGARVKCRKCGDSIVVLKDGGPAPPAPGGDGFFDLGSAVRDSAGESPGSPPPVGNLIPFPAPSRPAEPGAKEPSSPALQAEKQGKDEVDLAFDRFLSAGAEASSPSLLTLDFGPEEKLDLPPAAALEPPFGEPPAVEPAAGFRGEGGFLISDSEPLDFLRESHRDAGAEAPPGVGDISLEISSAPVDKTSSFLREPYASPTPREDWASPTPGEIPFEGNVTPPAAPVIEVPPHREEEPAPERPVESPVRRGSPAPEAPRPRSSAGPAVAAVLAVLLAAGGYLGLTTSGRKTLEGAVPGVAALWEGKPAAPAAPKYDLRNVIGYYESGGASPRILVIKGQVANLSTVEKSGIRIHAALLDNTDAVLMQQAVYAGNMLSGEAIRKGDRDTLSKALGNRFGEGLANMHVGPGKAIPFMVVFFDAPENMDSYKLEAKDGE